MNLADFHFLRPWWLLALLPTAGILIALARRRLGSGRWQDVCDAELLPFILQDKPAPKGRLSMIGTGLATMAAIFALAGPTWQRLPGPAFRNDAALVIALDLSKSMDAADTKPSRLGKARYKIADLLKQRRDGQTALLVYGGDSFTVTPLTSDTATIDSQLPALTTDIMPSPGSDAGNAVQRATDLLRQAGLVRGHILLVADGADADLPDQISAILGDYRLSVLAVGTPEGAPIQMGGSGFVKDASGNIVLAKLDEATLERLALQGQGIYQTVTADDTDIERLGRLFNTADTNPQNQDSNLLLQQWDDLGPWLLLLVLPWAALRFRKGLLVWGLVCLLPWPRDSQAIDWKSLWQTPNQRAQQAFNQQQYQQAAEQFDNLDWRAAAQYRAGQYQQAAETLKNTQSADGHYNRGNALAKAGQLQDALQAYQQALQLDPNHQDAKFNKALVEKKLNEQQKPQDKPQQGEQQQSSQQPEKQQQQDQQSGQSQSDKNREQQPNEQQGAKPQANDQQNQGTADKQKPENQAQPPAQPNQPTRDEPAESKQATAATEKDETERANEQLLKRIPDEPTGLLKRKFKYQYSQRNRSGQTQSPW